MQKAEPIHYYRKKLYEELDRRVRRNPRYSMRSFASALGLNSGDLSQILSGKRSVSAKVAKRILNHLELNQDETKRFIDSIIDEKKNKGLKKISVALKEQAKEASPSSQITHDVSIEEFRVISDWYHTAILELTTSHDFKADPSWIAKALGISPTESKIALMRLFELGLLEKVQGTYKKTNLKIQTKDQTKSTIHHRKRQHQILEKSIHSLENDPIDERNHSAMTLCIDPKHLPEAKEKIRKLMWELSQFLITGEPQRVYELQVSLFPLQQ